MVNIYYKDKFIQNILKSISKKNTQKSTHWKQKSINFPKTGVCILFL
jgi:hypothetical protein